MFFTPRSSFTDCVLSSCFVRFCTPHYSLCFAIRCGGLRVLFFFSLREDICASALRTRDTHFFFLCCYFLSHSLNSAAHIFEKSSLSHTYKAFTNSVETFSSPLRFCRRYFHYKIRGKKTKPRRGILKGSGREAYGGQTQAFIHWHCLTQLQTSATQVAKPGF